LVNARHFPEIVNRFHYYHPKLKGNFSLKATSEINVYPELHFSEQKVNSGKRTCGHMNVYESLLEETNLFYRGSKTKNRSVIAIWIR